jgi:hypothetical protein
MDEDLYGDLLRGIASHGYDLNRLQPTLQPGG